MKSLILAIQFMTRVPLPAVDADMRDMAGAMRWFPLTGVIVGLAVWGAIAGVAILLGGAAMLIIARSYGVMVRAFPVAGAEFAYAYHACGRYHAYVCGWFLALGYLSIVPLNATALAVLGKFVAPQLFARGYLYTVAGFEVFAGEILLGSAAIVGIGLFQIRGVRSVGHLQVGMTALLVGGVLAGFNKPGWWIIEAFWQAFIIKRLNRLADGLGNRKEGWLRLINPASPPTGKRGED